MKIEKEDKINLGTFVLFLVIPFVSLIVYIKIEDCITARCGADMMENIGKKEIIDKERD